MDQTVRRASDRRFVRALAIAGLLPAIAGVALVEWADSSRFLTIYSVSIVAFLSGAWWSAALMQRVIDSRLLRATLVLSNAATLSGVAAVLFLGDIALLVLAAIYIALLYGERAIQVFANQPPYYRSMRRNVTLAMVGLHLLAFWRAS